jgi:hypothetical protein
MNTRAATAVSKGASAIVTSTLATVVRVMATMKKVNMPHQHKPDIHRAAPPWRMRLEHTAPLEHRQDHQQAEHGEEAAPEGDLKAARLLQMGA